MWSLYLFPYKHFNLSIFKFSKSSWSSSISSLQSTFRVLSNDSSAYLIISFLSNKTLVNFSSNLWIISLVSKLNLFVKFYSDFNLKSYLSKIFTIKDSVDRKINLFFGTEMELEGSFNLETTNLSDFSFLKWAISSLYLLVSSYPKLENGLFYENEQIFNFCVILFWCAFLYFYILFFSSLI